jgi:hypothetical protein
MVLTLHAAVSGLSFPSLVDGFPLYVLLAVAVCITYSLRTSHSNSDIHFFTPTGTPLLFSKAKACLGAAHDAVPQPMKPTSDL